jgi:hypothetical protein
MIEAATEQVTEQQASGDKQAFRGRDGAQTTAELAGASPESPQGRRWHVYRVPVAPVKPCGCAGRVPIDWRDGAI